MLLVVFLNCLTTFLKSENDSKLMLVMQLMSMLLD